MVQFLYSQIMKNWQQSTYPAVTLCDQWPIQPGIHHRQLCHRVLRYQWRYQAFGQELIPVSRHSAHRPLSHNPVARYCYFPTETQLPSQQQCHCPLTGTKLYYLVKEAAMKPGQDFWPVTRPDPMAFDPVTRSDPVSSLNDVKSRNVVTSQGQTARK